MRSGIGFPSYSAQAAWGGAGVSPNYPAANAGNLRLPSKPVRLTSASPSLSAVLPAAVPIQFLAVVGHTAPSGTVSVWLGNTGDPFPSGPNVVWAQSQALWPAGSTPVAGYPWVRPIVLPYPVMARTVWISFYDTPTPFDIAAIEVAGWWEWDGISPGKEAGVESRAVDVALLGGARRPAAAAAPRVTNGQIDYVALGVKTDAALDFQRITDLDQPFVFVQDADDPTTLPRSCYLARNAQVPPLVGALYRHDRFEFRFVEHWR